LQSVTYQANQRQLERRGGFAADEKAQRDGSLGDVLLARAIEEKTVDLDVGESGRAQAVAQIVG
jgi:hypothetical protein